MRSTTKRIRSSMGNAVEIPVDGLRLVALSDGFLDLDLSRFPDVVRPLADDMAEKGGIDLDDMTISINAFMIVAGDRICLVDAGMGKSRGETMGHLPNAIKAAGFDPEDVTDLLMTHLHGDHAAGLIKDGVPVFPNAQMMVTVDEKAFWDDPSKLDEIQTSQLPYAIDALKAYRERLVLAEPGKEVLPGVEMVGLPGHTPGQVGYRIGTTDPVLVSGDAIHMPELQVAQPDWGFLFDADKAGAQATRRSLLKEASTTGLRLAGAHIAYPGVIRVIETDAGLGYESGE